MRSPRHAARDRRRTRARGLAVDPVRPAGPNLPFSTAVITGSTIYLSGQIGTDPKTTR